MLDEQWPAPPVLSVRMEEVGENAPEAESLRLIIAKSEHKEEHFGVDIDYKAKLRLKAGRQEVPLPYGTEELVRASWESWASLPGIMLTLMQFMQGCGGICWMVVTEYIHGAHKKWTFMGLERKTKVYCAHFPKFYRQPLVL